MTGGAAPIKVGILNDLADGPSSDVTGGGGLVGVMQLAIDSVRASGRLDRDIEFVSAYGLGLPRGTAVAVEHAYAQLVAAGVLLVVGPAIGDNALVAAPLAEAARLPTIQWSGTERARNEWAFHLQVGSHENEGAVLARHLQATGARRVAFVFDRSPIGKRYATFFEAACEVLGVELVSRRSVSPIAVDALDDVRIAMGTGAESLVYLGLGLTGQAVAQAHRELGWDVPGIMGCAGMFGHSPGFAPSLDGWMYIDMYSDSNTTFAAVCERLGPRRGVAGVAHAYDLGLLVAEGLARAPELTRGGVREGLELVKWLPAAEGYEGTLLEFGHHNRGALHGEYLVLRQWQGSRSVEVDRAR